MSSNTLSTGKNLPPTETPFVSPQTGILTNDGYLYLLGLINQIVNAIPTSSVDRGVKAQGLSQATAMPLSAQWTEVDTADVNNTGVLLDSLQPGQAQTVFNQSGITIEVYPPPGMNIDAAASNVPYALGSGLRQSFDFLSTTQVRSGD